MRTSKDFGNFLSHNVKSEPWPPKDLVHFAEGRSVSKPTELCQLNRYGMRGAISELLRAFVDVRMHCFIDECRLHLLLPFSRVFINYIMSTLCYSLCVLCRF